MPPHRIYVEAFLGSGAILRRKKPAAAANIGIDVDRSIIARHVTAGLVGTEFVCGDALEWLQQRPIWQGDELIYCDPPYLGSARHRPGQACYDHEMMSDEAHERLLRILTTLPTMVMLSGYRSALYDSLLTDWRRLDYPAMTRGGVKIESCWMNFPAPASLHDYSFLGKNFQDRCRLQRKIARWTSRLAGLPTLERAAILAALRENARG